MNKQLSIGISLIIASEFFLVTSGMLIKTIGDDLPMIMLIFARSVFMVILLLPWVYQNGLKAVKTERIKLHLFRSLVGLSGAICLFYTWGNLPLAQAALLKQTSPFFIPVIAFFWLGEAIPGRIRTAIFIGFIGVLIILNPQNNQFTLFVIIGLCGAIFAALAKVIVRRLRSTESATIIVFYFSVISMLVSFVPALIFWKTPTTTEFTYLILMAISSTIAQLLFSRAYGYAPASQLGVYTYMSVIFATMFGWLIWLEIPTDVQFYGMAIVILGGILATTVNYKARINAEV